MISQNPRDPWRMAWQVATSDILIAALLVGTAAGLALATWLPQTPFDNPVSYARWLSDVQARFRDATPSMQALGLFNVTRSFSFRALLALLAGCLLLRLIEGGDRMRRHREMAQPAGEWRTLEDENVHLQDALDDLRHRRYRVLRESSLIQADRWPWADLLPALVRAGGLVLLLGLLITAVWGWRVEGLTVQGSQPVPLPGTQAWVAVNAGGCRVKHSAGIVTFVEKCGPGVQVSAVDRTGRALSLQQTAEGDPQTEVTMALTEEQYFAIPEARLIVGIAPQPGPDSGPHDRALVRVFRSPSGNLINETVMDRDTELSVDDVTLILASRPYALLTATFNPGRWPTTAGLVLLTAGLMGSLAWPARRFWLREGSGGVEGSGDLPPLLAPAEEA